VARQRRGRLAALLTASTLALTLLATAVPSVTGADSRSVFVGSGTTDGILTSSTVSAGQTTSFKVVVKNTGGQTLNNVLVTVGYDADPAAERNTSPYSAIVPTAPVAFPGGVTISYVTSGCTGGGTAGPLVCDVATLRKGGSFTITALVTTPESLGATSLPIKAVAKVAENTNDNGANKDTFAAEGTVTVNAFSCDSVTVYRAQGSKEVSTCAVDDTRNTNGQSAKIILPTALTTATLSEVAEACPAELAFCLGAAVVADITGDSPADLIVWTLQYYVGTETPQLNKIVVNHYDDAGTLIASIPNTNKYRCKSGSQKECIASVSVTNGVLTIVVQTGGNGKMRA
jgi:hypothetical protein